MKNLTPPITEMSEQELIERCEKRIAQVSDPEIKPNMLRLAESDFDRCAEELVKRMKK